MSGIRCQMCDYDLDDCNCVDRWGEDGRPGKDEELIVECPAPGLFTQMGLDEPPNIPELKQTLNERS